MELSWTTFLLEIINFLVLVFILQRFLYKPVLGVVEARQKHVQEALRQAESTQAEAEALKEQYEGRLQAWENERESHRQSLRNDIESERSRQLSKLRDQMAHEREKANALAQHEAAQVARRLESRAVQQGSEFVSKLLKKVADEDLEGRLVDLAVKQLVSLPTAQREQVGTAYAKGNGSVRVVSAGELTSDRRSALERALEKLLGAHVDCDYQQDPGLMAGVRVLVGPWILDTTLAGELDAFVRSSHE